MGDKRDRYRIPSGVKKEALQGRDLRAMHGYGGGKVTKRINKKLRYQKDIGYKTAVSVDTYYRRHEKVDPPAENFDNKKNPSKGLIMWKMMGGNSGQSWSRRLKKSLDVIQKKEKLNKIINTVEAIQLGILR